LYRHDLSKYSRPVQISAAANISTFFWEFSPIFRGRLLGS
jgi:hypothetical protein